MLFAGLSGVLGIYWNHIGLIGQLGLLYSFSAIFTGAAYYLNNNLNYSKATTVLVLAGLVFFVGALLHTNTALELGIAEHNVILVGSLIAIPVA